MENSFNRFILIDDNNKEIVGTYATIEEAQDAWDRYAIVNAWCDEDGITDNEAFYYHIIDIA